MSTTGNAGEQYFENLFNPNTGADALQDIEDFTEFMETFDTVTTGHVLLKQSEDPREFGGIAKATASTPSTLVERGSDGSVTADTIVIDDTTYAATIDTATLSAARTLTIPDETGTVVTSVNTDFVANNTQRTNINALTDGEYIQKTGTNTFSSKAATSTYSGTDSNLVERDSGTIKSAQVYAGEGDGNSSELCVRTVGTGASASIIASNHPTLNLIRNGGSKDYGGDGASDWRFQNSGGIMYIERGNSFLTGGVHTAMAFNYGYTIDINPYRTGYELHDTVELRMYRQVSGATNSYYVDLKPSNSVLGHVTQLFPGNSGTFILDSTTEYVGLNSLRDNYNARTTGTLIKKDSGDDAVGEEAFAEANTASTIVKRTSTNQINATNFVAPTGGNVYINDFRLHQVSGQNYVDYNGPVNFRVGGTSANFILNTGGYTWSMTGTGRVSGTSSKLSFSSDAALEIDAAGVVGGRLNVGTNGRVGIGCSSTFPAQHELDVNGNTPVIRISSYSTGSVGSPALEFVRGSQTYGGDDYADWRIQNYNGDLVFNIGSTYSTHVNGDVLKLTEEGQIYAGIASQTDGASTSDLVITKNNETQVEIELRSDRPTASNSDYQVGKIVGGFTSTDYRDAYIKLQTHNALTGNLVDTLTATNNRIGINDSTPSYTLDVNGTVRTQGGNVLFEAATQVTGTLTTSNTNVGGTLDVTGTLTTSNTEIGGTLDVTGVTTITGETQIEQNLFLYDHFGHGHSHLIEGRLDIHNVGEAIAIHSDSSETSGRISFTTDADGGAKSCFTLESQYSANLFAFCFDQNAVPSYPTDAVLTIGANNATGGGHLKLKYDGGQVSVTKGSNTASIGSNTLTADRVCLLPDADGTIALTSDIPAASQWTTTGSDIYYNSGNVFIGQTSGSEALEVTGNIKSTGNVQCNELQGTLGSSTKIDLTPGGGNIDIIVPNSSGSPSPNVDINFKTGSDIRMNLNSIDGLVFHDAFIFRNDVGSTYFPLSFNGAVANQLNIGTDTVNISTGDLTLASGDLTLTAGDLHIDAGSVEVDLGNVHLSNGNMYIGAIPGSVPIGIQNLYVEAGTTTAGVQAHVGVAVMGNGLADYAMFSHESHHTTGNYALLQQNDGETFLNAASNKQIHFRINNSTRGGIDDETGQERTFFIVPTQDLPLYNSSEQLIGNYCSLDNPAFRQFNADNTAQSHRAVMYDQVVVAEQNSGFVQVALPLTNYGTQPGYASGNPGYAFRVCDPGKRAEISWHFSGYTSSTNGWQTVNLQLYNHQPSGTKAWETVTSQSFYVNDRYQHLYISFTVPITPTYAYYSYARMTRTQGTFTADQGDIFNLSIRQLPRQTR